MSSNLFESLFAYGTLQDETVQHAHFHRKLDGVKDSLTGFERGTVTINGTIYPILRRTETLAEPVDGTVLQLTPSELVNADAYEGPDYKRVRVQLTSGTDAWVYIDARDHF